MGTKDIRLAPGLKESAAFGAGVAGSEVSGFSQSLVVERWAEDTAGLGDRCPG